MITAEEARKLSDEILEPVSGSIEFKAVMAQIDRDIRRAVKNGREEIIVKADLLQVYNNYKFPKCINSSKIDKNGFWWPYVKTELEKLGFKIFSTIVHATYKVAW